MGRRSTQEGLGLFGEAQGALDSVAILAAPLYPVALIEDAPFHPGQPVAVDGLKCRVKFARAKDGGAWGLTLEYLDPTPVSGPWWVIEARPVESGWKYGPWEVRV